MTSSCSVHDDFDHIMCRLNKFITRLYVLVYSVAILRLCLPTLHINSVCTSNNSVFGHADSLSRQFFINIYCCLCMDGTPNNQNQLNLILKTKIVDWNRYRLSNATAECTRQHSDRRLPIRLK